MKNCRVLITKQCNFDCSYCLMKDEATAATFIPIKFDEFVKIIQNYESFGITGGEPTICRYFLTKMLTTIRGCSDKPMFLYTNGTLVETIPEYALKCLSGINIGVHQGIDWEKVARLQAIVPVRLHIHKDSVTDEIRQKCLEIGATIKEFEYGQCDTVEEDRWFVD